MQSYTQSQVNPEIPGIILMSHGAFAVGLTDTVKMLFGSPENLAAFSLEPGDDIDEFRKLFVKSFESFPKGTVVMVDLFGGTPCNQALQYAQESGNTFELITGLNLPMLLSACIARQNKYGKELSLEAMENAKTGVSRVDIEAFLADDDEEEDE